MKRTGKEEESSKRKDHEEAAGASLQYAPAREPSVVPTSTPPSTQGSEEVHDELAKKEKSPLVYAPATAGSSSGGVPGGEDSNSNRKAKAITHAAPMEEESPSQSPPATFGGTRPRQQRQHQPQQQRLRGEESAAIEEEVESDDYDPEVPGATAIQAGVEVQRTKGRLTAQEEYETPTLQPRGDPKQQGNDIPVVTPEGIIDGKEILEGEDDTKLSRLQKIAIGIILVVIVGGLGYGIPAILAATKSKEPKTKYVSDPTISPAPTLSPTASPQPSRSSSPSQSPSTTYEKNLPTVMKELALTLSNSETLNDPSSPQSKAVEWLVEDELEHQKGWDVIELTQRYVLAVLYHSTRGYEWSNYAPESWFQASSVCEWSSHVICNENGAISSLSLGRDNLRGNIPIELDALTAMTSMYLYDNALTGPIPSELGQLTAMTSLALGDTALTGPIPSELGQLTALDRLFLDRNSLTGPIPSELGQLRAMSRLDLNGNTLTGIIPSELGQLRAMKFFWLHENSLTGPIPSELGQLTEMGYLYLYENFLTGTVPIELTQLIYLSKIYLNKNDLTGTVPIGFCAAPFPDWRNENVWSYVFATDCISQIQCDCCNVCYDEEGDFVS